MHGGLSYIWEEFEMPSNTPNVEEFRKMLSEYSYAMLLKIKRPEIPADDMYQYFSFYNDKINILLELEKSGV